MDQEGRRREIRKGRDGYAFSIKRPVVHNKGVETIIDFYIIMDLWDISHDINPKSFLFIYYLLNRYLEFLLYIIDVSDSIL